LIGIEPEDPLAPARQIPHGPFPLQRVRFESALENMRAKGARELLRAVRAAGIDHEYLERPVAHAGETGLEVLRLVEGQNDYSDRAALYAATSFEVTVSIE
jgi:hypothetical protein